MIRFREDILPLKDKLFRLALRITLDRDEAEDVVQDTMLRLWEGREQWPSIQNIEAYATTLCRNMALDSCKAARQSNLSLNEELDAPADPTTPLELLDRKQRIEHLHRLIDGLPELQRSIIHLRDIEGRPYEEIATLLSISLSQVKVYLHRARQRLRAEAERFEG